MDSSPAFVCVGGDARMLYLAELLQAEGRSVTLCAAERAEFSPCPQGGLDACRFADCVILPVPAVRDGRVFAPWAAEPAAPGDVIGRMAPGALLAGGLLPPELAAEARARGLAVFDYYAHPGLIERNAVPTAEGAIALAMDRAPITLHGSRALVIGFGRVGKALSVRLAALGARTFVSARKEGDLAAIEGLGMTALRTDALRDHLSAFDFIFNTVPAPVLGAGELAAVRRSCLVMELASAPGGVDRAAAGALGRNLILAPGLPGKAAPLTAARIIRDVLAQRLREGEVRA